jgi:hypothetical protein
MEVLPPVQFLAKLKQAYDLAEEDLGGQFVSRGIRPTPSDNQ